MIILPFWFTNLYKETLIKMLSPRNQSYLNFLVGNSSVFRAEGNDWALAIGVSVKLLCFSSFQVICLQQENKFDTSGGPGTGDWETELYRLFDANYSSPLIKFLSHRKRSRTRKNRQRELRQFGSYINRMFHFHHLQEKIGRKMLLGKPTDLDD